MIPGWGSNEDDADNGVVFRDLLMLWLSAVVVCLCLAMPHIANHAAKAAATENAQPPGNVMIEARWPDGMDADVDLWVQAPGDAPVGYSNKGGAVFNLLRDDLGMKADATGLNYEISFARGLLPGEYTANLHLYRNELGGDVPVTVVVSVKAATEQVSRQILTSSVELKYEGQELTVFRFRLDAAGNLVPGSVTNLQKPLRDWKPS